MTVRKLEALLKNFPGETKILVLVTTKDGQRGVDVKDDFLTTFIRPDHEQFPSSVLFVPQVELVKA